MELDYKWYDVIFLGVPMDNASLIFDDLSNCDSIKALIGKQEEVFLDFKESRTTNGALLDDDRAHFGKAASGFAHQQGGVLVWGIEARKNEDGVDEARALKPIPNIKRFFSDLNGYVKYSTDPVVDGIQSRIIYEDDNENSNKGFAVTLFPRSDSVHRALGKRGWSGFYKRYGDSFVPLSTADIRDLFFRNLSPDLELRAAPRPDGTLTFSLYNRGKGVAKYPSVQFSLSPFTGGQWCDSEGDLNFRTGWLEQNRPGPYRFQFMTSSGVVVHPDQELGILIGPMQMAQPRKITRVDYRLFAENMVPKKGTIEL
jgi:hypothetical protein